MKPIGSKTPTLREFLGRSKYSFPVSQRGFVWNDSQITAFVSSLMDSFFASYRRTDGKTQVTEYNYHFLGQFFIVRDNSENVIWDGKQRLVSLLLMLIYASKELIGYDEVKLIKDMIRWDSNGDTNFNLNLPDAHNCLLALLGESSDPELTACAIDKSLCRGYYRVSQLLTSQLGDPKVMHVFAHWLSIRTVLLVNTIQADAFFPKELFHTLNNSGRSILRGEANNLNPVSGDPDTKESEI